MTQTSRPGFVRAAIAACVLGSGGACTSSQQAPGDGYQQALASVGDRAALEGLRTLVVQATGSSFAYDEGPEPADRPFASSDFKVVSSIDVVANGFRLAHERTYKLIRPGKMARYDEVIADKLGYIVGDERVTGGVASYTAKMASARVFSTRRQQMMLHPHLLLRGLTLADVSDLGSADLGGRPHQRLQVRDPDGVADIELSVDAATGRLSALATRESDHLRGDTAVRFLYEGWDSHGGLMFPTRVTVEVDGQVVRTEERTAISVNAALPADVLAFPGEAPTFDEQEAVRGRKRAQSYQRFAGMGVANSQEFPKNTVTGVELGAGSGIYHLVGASHHSLLIDQGQAVVLVDAPNDAARARAILGWIEATLPGGLAANKVSHVVLTHHHVDHSSGLRTFVAAGAVAVVGEESRSLWNKVLAAPRTIEPDDLVGKAAPASALVTVKLGASFQQGNVTAHHIANRHSSDTLIIHVTAPGHPPVLFITDIYIPGTGILAGSNFVAWSKDLDDGLAALGLNQDGLTIVGGHGNVDAMGKHFVVPYPMFKAQLATAMAAP
jgi:glyoxylase-like metal-dependent hydrolase (beta-lactamase superfamily II)